MQRCSLRRVMLEDPRARRVLEARVEGREARPFCGTSRRTSSVGECLLLHAGSELRRCDLKLIPEKVRVDEIDAPYSARSTGRDIRIRRTRPSQSVSS